MIKCDILTLFPDVVRPFVEHSILGRAHQAGLVQVRLQNLRDFTRDRHRSADDHPYGGGAGMVLLAEPIYRAIETIAAEGEPLRLFLTSPQGRVLTPALARELAVETRRMVFICGRYEGVDERVRLGLAPEEVSIGDYVLTNGELAALVVIDAAVRWVPGVLGDPRSAAEESFSEALLEYPHYTRPAELHGMRVPDVLLSGNHGAIRRWRRKQALWATWRKRPDLLEQSPLSAEDRGLLEEAKSENPQE